MQLLGGAERKMILETSRLILRPWTAEDAPELFKYASDPGIGPAAGWAAHKSVEESSAVIDGVLSAPGTFAVVLRETGLPVGSVGIVRPPRVPGAGENEAELGCWLGRPYWGRGLIPEALGRLLESCFFELGCEAVWYCWYDGNDKSRRVGEKLGFTYHHSEENVDCPLIGERRTEHCARLEAGAYRALKSLDKVFEAIV